MSQTLDMFLDQLGLVGYEDFSVKTCFALFLIILALNFVADLIHSFMQFGKKL